MQDRSADALVRVLLNIESFQNKNATRVRRRKRASALCH
jgi:hypothetical protein